MNRKPFKPMKQNIFICDKCKIETSIDLNATIPHNWSELTAHMKQNFHLCVDCTKTILSTFQPFLKDNMYQPPK